MKAMVLHETGGPLVLEDVPVPVPGPGEVLVRVRACGLGLTLVWNRDGRHGPGRLPRIIGHEVAGEVVEIGPPAADIAGTDAADVANIATGDGVAVYYYLTCGSCEWCRAGREDLCDDRAGSVGREIDGGLAEYVRLPARNLSRIPPEVSDVDAAVTADAVATAVHVLTARAQTEPGETVVVLGAGGGVGIHAVQVAKLLGARVIAVDIDAGKLELARRHGADDAIDGRTDDVVAEIARLTDRRGADVVVDMVGETATLASAAASLAKGGRLVLVGSYDRAATLPLTHATLAGERSVLGSQYCTRDELERALDHVAGGRLRPVVSQTCRLDEADSVLRMVERMEVAGRACVVFP